jgi:hypothetical protein
MKDIGPSTNGRSSAFGALCLGSNPSGPAKFDRVIWKSGDPVIGNPLVVRTEDVV